MLTFDYAPIDSGVRRLHLQATDMGAVLRATDTDPNVDGGYLEITGETESPDPLSPLKGEVEGDGFRIHDAPILARLLTLASLTGIVEALDGGGVVFDRITGSFEFDFERNAISTELVRIYGTSIGITTQGTVDLGKDHVQVRGVVVPAYFLNRILGAIPIVGRILTGGEGEGLIAFTYKVEGPATSPEVSVNPLSGLTPGFLRGVFNIFGSDDDSADSEAPAPAALPDDEEP